MPVTAATPEEVVAAVQPVAEAVEALDTRVKTLEDAPEPEKPADPIDYAPAIKAVDDKVEALDDRVEKLETVEPPAPVAYVGMPYTVIGNGVPPTDQQFQAGIKKWVDFRKGNFPMSHLVFNWIGTAWLTTPILQYLLDNHPAIPQLQGARWHGISKRGTGIGWKNADIPLLTSDGDLRNWDFKDFTFASGTPRTAPAKGLLFLSNEDGGKTGSDGYWERIEFMGAWDYGIAFDGGVKANLNSEQAFNRFACGQSFSSARGLVVVGLSGDDAQEDQFLNFSFRDTKLEGSHGDYLVFNKGGSVTIDGYNSWLHTGTYNLNDDGSINPSGRMLYMPATSHFDSVQSLEANGVLRAEVRGLNSKVMECGWNASARVAFRSLNTAAQAFKFKTYPGTEDITLTNGAHLFLDQPSLGGHIGLRGKGGTVEIRNPKIVRGVEGVTATTTIGTGLGLVRNYTAVPQTASFR